MKESDLEFEDTNHISKDISVVIMNKKEPSSTREGTESMVKK